MRKHASRRGRGVCLPAVLCLIVVAGVPHRSLPAESLTPISGRVLDAATGEPLPGVTVGLVPAQAVMAAERGAPVRPMARTRTDETGVYTLMVPQTLAFQWGFLFTLTEDRPDRIYPDARYDGEYPLPEDFIGKTNPISLARAASSYDFLLLPPPYREQNVMVPMRDGVRLATDLVMPVGQAAYPALVQRTAYEKGSHPFRSKTVDGEDLDPAYVYVSQDVRGRFKSEGVSDMPFLPDGWSGIQDGYDTIEWIARQPWCDGNIGTVGGSAAGITQVMTAAANPPSLKCQTITMGCSSFYHHAAYPGGVFRKSLIENWLGRSFFSSEAMETILLHPSYDAIWSAMDAGSRAEHVNVPGLFIGGWYDALAQGTLDAFTERQTRGGPGARGRQMLVMGPWTHDRTHSIGDFRLPPHARQPPVTGLTRRWNDHWLRGIPTGVTDLPPVHYYVLGAFDEPGAPGHEWRTSTVWPIPSTDTPLYFHGQGELSRYVPVIDEASRSYHYDPANPVPTRGGGNLAIDSGPLDQRPVENRDDVLLFTSVPLPIPVEVTGRIRASLWVSSSAPDTDFTVKLTDVYPDGRSILLVDGIQRARYRESFVYERFLEPGEVAWVEVDLGSISYVFNRGHRIRVAVSSSNSPRFEPNPNTDEPFRFSDRKVIAENRIFVDAFHPSHITLPLVLPEPTPPWRLH